jgi:hypothetical protein
MNRTLSRSIRTWALLAATFPALGFVTWMASPTSAAPLVHGVAPAPVDTLGVATKIATSDDFKSRVYPNTPWFKAQPEASRPKTVDCTQFLSAVVAAVFAEAGKAFTAETKSRVMLSNFTADELKTAALDQLVDGTDKRILGVQYALTEAGVGEAVAGIAQAKPGDFVQYWYKEGGHWAGHSGIIVSITGTKAVLLGSHMTTLASEDGAKPADKKGGVGQSIPIDLGTAGKKVYIVRFTATKKP